MNALAADYAALLSETRPEVIRDERQNQAYIGLLEKLTSKKSVTRAEEKLIELLAVLIEDFETKHFPVPEAAPVAIVRHLMETHGLRQKDLVSIFGTESIASEVLHGKRELTKEHIKRLSAQVRGVACSVLLTLALSPLLESIQKPEDEYSDHGVGQRGDGHVAPTPFLRLAKQAVRHTVIDSLVSHEKDVGDDEARAGILDVNLQAQ